MPPLDQFSSTELSEIMEMFYICTVGSNSHSPPTKGHVWLVAIMFDNTNLDTQIYIQTTLFWGCTRGKESACQRRRHKRCRFSPWVGKIPWRKTWQPSPVFFPGKFQGQRSLGWATVHGVTKSQTPLSVNTHTYTHTHTLFSRNQHMLHMFKLLTSKNSFANWEPFCL